MFVLDELLAAEHFYASVIILFITILIKAIVDHFVNAQPLNYFNIYCQRLAGKVNKASNSVQQQKVAGFISVLVTLIPILVLVMFFDFLVAMTWLWQGLVLYVSLGNLALSQRNKAIAKALAQQNKAKAKQLLTPFVLRDTEPLSPLGLCKASIEMQLLRSCQLLVCVSFYFLCFGTLGAIAMRLLFEMHYAWNIKLARFQHFGQFVSQLVKLLQWLPSRLFAYFLLLATTGKNFLLCWRLVRGKIFKLSNSLLLHLMALNIETRLSGVAMYTGSKLRKASFNDSAREVQITDILHANRCIVFTLLMMALPLIMLAVVSYLLNH